MGKVSADSTGSAGIDGGVEIT